MGLELSDGAGESGAHSCKLQARPFQTTVEFWASGWLIFWGVSPRKDGWPKMGGAAVPFFFVGAGGGGAVGSPKP